MPADGAWAWVTRLLPGGRLLAPGPALSWAYCPGLGVLKFTFFFPFNFYLIKMQKKVST